MSGVIAAIVRAWREERAPYDVPRVRVDDLRAMRALVATVRVEDLPELMHCAADTMIKTRDPVTRGRHWAKFIAARERLDAWIAGVEDVR